MDRKLIKPPTELPPGNRPQQLRPQQKPAVSPAAKTLQKLQNTADQSKEARKLRQLKKLAYLRPNATALRQLSGEERKQLQLVRQLCLR